MAEAAVWDVERVRPIVAEWDEALRAELPAYKRLVHAAEARGSLLRPPAAPDAVVAAEARLGARLPPSYRSFLLIADGADAGARAPSYVLRGLGEIEQRLLGAEEVAAFSDDDNLAWLVDMWRGNMQEFADRQELPAEEPVQVFDFDPGVNALLITVPVQDGIVGLVPFDPEWQVWEFFWDEVRAHRSFADFLSFVPARMPCGSRSGKSWAFGGSLGRSSGCDGPRGCSDPRRAREHGPALRGTRAAAGSPAPERRPVKRVRSLE